MSAGSWPWVFGSGTGVLGRLGPVRLPFAAIGYHLVQEIVEESVVHCMPNAGTGRMQATYEFIEHRLLKRAGDGKVNLAGHSQPASHYLRFAALHPEKVGVVLSVAGAHYGSRLATRWPLSIVPCSIDLAPNSAYLLNVQEEFQCMLAETPSRRRPTVICYGLPGDRVVDPWQSSLVPGAKNVVLAQVKPTSLPYGATWEQTSKEYGHFDVILSHETIGIIAKGVHSRRRSQPRRPVRQSGGNLAVSGRQAA